MKRHSGMLWMAAVMLFVLSVPSAAIPQAAAPELGTVKSITLPDIRFDLNEGPDRIKVETNCTICHSTDYIPMQPLLSKQQWTGIVDKMMKTYGAPVSPEDRDKIINYLSVAYGSGK